MGKVLAGGTGGGGAGFALGPAQNTFNGATKAAAQTARDTYAAANATWLAQYAASDSLMIRLTWPTTPTSEAYEQRVGSNWIDITPVIRGPKGIKGDKGDPGPAVPLSDDDPQALAAAAAEGTSTSASRSDHVHPLPGAATTSAAGLMSSGDKSKLDGIASGAQVNPTDAQIGDKAFSNPPSDLTDSEKTAVRTAAGAQAALTDAQIGDKAFSNPPSDLSDAEKTAARSAIGAGTSSGGGAAPTSANTPGVGAAITVEDVSAAKTLEYGKVYHTSLSPTLTLPAAAHGDTGKTIWVVRGGSSGEYPTIAAPSGASIYGVSGNSFDLEEAGGPVELRVLDANLWALESADLPPLPVTAGSYVAKRASSGLVEWAAAPTGGGTALTDDAVLDLVKETRTSADRGKALGVSTADENVLAFLTITGGGSSLTLRGAWSATGTYAVGDIVYTGAAATVWYLCAVTRTATTTRPVNDVRGATAGHWIPLPGGLRSWVSGDYYPRGYMVSDSSGVFIAESDVTSSADRTTAPAQNNKFAQIDVESNDIPALPTGAGRFILSLVGTTATWQALADTDVLNLASASRTSADRGKALAVGASDENVLELKAFPTGGGSATPLSDDNPQAPGTAAPGTSTSASRADHVHPLPTDAQLIALATGRTAEKAYLGSTDGNNLIFADPLAPLAGDADDRFFEWSGITPDQMNPSFTPNFDGLMGATTDATGAPTLANVINSWAALTAGTRTFWFGKNDEGGNNQVAKAFSSAMAAALVRLSNIGAGDQATNSVTLSNVSAVTERTERSRTYWSFTATVALNGTLSGTGGPIAAHDVVPTTRTVRIPISGIVGSLAAPPVVWLGSRRLRFGQLVLYRDNWYFTLTPNSDSTWMAAKYVRATGLLATDLEVQASERTDVAPSVAQARKYVNGLARYRAGADVPNPGVYSASPPRKPILSLVKAAADAGSMFDDSNRARGVRLADTAVDSGRAVQLISPAADPLNTTLKASIRTDAPGSTLGADARWGYIFGFATQQYSASNVAQDTRALSRGGFAEFIWMGDANKIRFDPKKLTSPASNTNFTAAEVEWAAVPSGTLAGPSGITGAAVGGTDSGGNALTNAQLSVTFASSGDDAIDWGASDSDDEFGFIVFYNEAEGGFDHYMGKRGFEILVGRLKFRTAAADPFEIRTNSGATWQAGDFRNAPGTNYFFKSHPRNPGDLDAYLTEFVLDSTANRIELVPGAVKTDIIAANAVIPSKVAISNRANSRLLGISAAGVFEAVQHADVTGIDINRDVTTRIGTPLQDADKIAIVDDSDAGKPTEIGTLADVFDYNIRTLNAHRNPEADEVFYQWLDADDEIPAGAGIMKVVRSFSAVDNWTAAGTSAAFNAISKTPNTEEHFAIASAAIASGLNNVVNSGGQTATAVAARTSGTGVLALLGSTARPGIQGGVYTLTATTAGNTSAARFTFARPDSTSRTAASLADLAADNTFGFDLDLTTDAAVGDIFTVTVTLTGSRASAAEGDEFLWDGWNWRFRRNLFNGIAATAAGTAWYAAGTRAIPNGATVGDAWIATGAVAITSSNVKEADGTTDKTSAGFGELFYWNGSNWVLQWDLRLINPEALPISNPTRGYIDQPNQRNYAVAGLTLQAQAFSMASNTSSPVAAPSISVGTVLYLHPDSPYSADFIKVTVLEVIRDAGRANTYNTEDGQLVDLLRVRSEFSSQRPVGNDSYFWRVTSDQPDDHLALVPGDIRDPGEFAAYRISTTADAVDRLRVVVRDGSAMAWITGERLRDRLGGGRLGPVALSSVLPTAGGTDGAAYGTGDLSWSIDSAAERGADALPVYSTAAVGGANHLRYRTHPVVGRVRRALLFEALEGANVNTAAVQDQQIWDMRNWSYTPWDGGTNNLFQLAWSATEAVKFRGARAGDSARKTFGIYAVHAGSGLPQNCRIRVREIFIPV